MLAVTLTKLTPKAKKACRGGMPKQTEMGTPHLLSLLGQPGLWAGLEAHLALCRDLHQEEGGQTAGNHPEPAQGQHRGAGSPDLQGSTADKVLRSTHEVSLAGILSTRPSCSKPHPTWRGTFQGWVGIPASLGRRQHILEDNIIPLWEILNLF